MHCMRAFKITLAGPKPQEDQEFQFGKGWDFAKSWDPWIIVYLGALETTEMKDLGN